MNDRTRPRSHPRTVSVSSLLSGLVLAVSVAGSTTGLTISPEPGQAASDHRSVTEKEPAAISYRHDDPMFTTPYIDIDEWRDTPTRHRYVHGGFENTDTRFSFYFPPAQRYEGRFFQYITPVPDSENLSQGASGEEDKISFAIDSGAYFVETNGGGREGISTAGIQVDPTIGAYRANAAAARFSRSVATQMYGTGRPFGYSFGGSGGAFRTLAGVENTEGVWDGSVPFVAGSPMALPNLFTIRVYALRVLSEKLPEIADAVDVGSNLDPFTDVGLNSEERAALLEATRMGFPLRGWHTHSYLGLHAFAVIFPIVVQMDPGYFEDFWTKPGYEGFEPTASLKKALLDHSTSIKKLIYVDEAMAMGLKVGHLAGRPRGLADDAWKALQGEHGQQIPVAIQVTSAPEKDTLGADLRVVSGAAAGSTLPMARVENDIVLLSPGSEATVAELEDGDKLHFDNRNFLAVQTYHRHQVPGPEFVVWDQFRQEDGTPRYPQRPRILGPLLARGATGTAQTGKFNGRMILVENLYDTEAYAWQADWYRSRAREHLGDDLENHFRVWMTDHANHGDFSAQRDPTHTVSFLGVLQQALRDLSAWVEEGIEPPESTVYTLEDGQVVVPATAVERKGIQPIVHVLANGHQRAEVNAGDTVALEATVDIPSDTGELVSAEWDLDGSGDYETKGSIVTDEDGLATVSLHHRFQQAGTYFPTLRVASQRDGNAKTPFARVQNLGRVRVVVN